MAAAIRFIDVSKRFGRATLALDRATWEVAEGCRACLLGPNGAGKSTSIRLLQGALEPTGGVVELLGAGTRSRAYAAARARCGIVPQQPGVYRDLTAGDYLRLSVDLYGHGNRDELVEVFGLGEHLEKRMTDLSGGLQRRLVLAAALVSEPDLLLLDEPTVGLDPVAAREVHNYLLKCMRGRTVLLCTHNLHEAEALCDEAVILREGRVVVQGRLDELRRQGQPRLRLRARQGPDAIARMLGEARSAVDDDGTHLLVEVDSADDDAPHLLRYLLGEGIDVRSCEPVQSSLTDVFLAAVEEEGE